MRELVGLRRLRPTILAVTALMASPCVAVAGPPFLTDDPEPTDAGHWENYAPALAPEGRGSARDGELLVELNYGAAPNLQLTLDLPTAFARDAFGSRYGLGDLAVSAKYRFFHDEAKGISVATFPGLTLPTATKGLGAPSVTAFLPVWAQWDSGPWSVFGGGGYAINPGAGNRDYWKGGVAATRKVAERLLVGVEIDRQGPDTDDGSASTSAGIGAILQLPAPFRLLASGGPTFFDHGAPLGYHAYVALGLDF